MVRGPVRNLCSKPEDLHVKQLTTRRQDRHVSLENGPRCQIPCQFVLNRVLVRIVKNLVNTGGYLLGKHKVVVFRNFASNVVVLCY